MSKNRSRPRRPAPRRTAFAPIGGEIVGRGDADAARALIASWRAAVGDGRTLTHGFHAYPARMHPEQARTLIEQFSTPGGVVVDPFCGSGTVVVEAFANGRRAIGGDVNPLAVSLTHLKSRRVPGPARRAIEEAAAALARAGTRAARSRHQDPADAPPEARHWFAPHVVRELGAISDGIAAVTRPDRRAALRLVLSSILVKVSRQQAETDRRRGDHDVPPGATSRLFAERAVELGRSLALLERAASRPPSGASAPPPPIVVRSDARSLPVGAGTVELVLSSPPYLGTYDYARMQELRAGALGLDLRDAEAREIGARSRANASGAPARYASDLARVLTEARRALRRDGACIVVVGDSIAGDETPVRGDQVIESAARVAGLTWIATASQDRPALPPAPTVLRREHVVLLRASV